MRLLSGRTVFGEREDVKHLRQEGLDVLSEAKDRYDSITEVVFEYDVSGSLAATQRRR